MSKKKIIKIPGYVKNDKAFIDTYVKSYKERYLKKDDPVKIVIVNELSHITNEFTEWANNDLPYLKKTIKKMLDEQHGAYKNSK